MRPSAPGVGVDRLICGNGALAVTGSKIAIPINAAQNKPKACRGFLIIFIT